ncbi:MAG: DUF4912 domain-containing protein [Elusimicrobiales bacterium]|jgi:hypothetical protein|nr:DUF4912 domain-containing protein [Elusimicrobiales bacterium]NLH38544.1 DUF4912 domain-containing protein [Elusimicrobiota bacterium]
MSESSGKIGPNQEPDYSSKSLPDGYGNTEAALLPRDPYWMFVYWEVCEKTKNNLISQIGKDTFDKSRSVIRVYEVVEGDNTGKYFDVPVIMDAKNWYINVSECGKTYLCELGLVTPDGKFIGIVKTNKVSLPRSGVSDVIDEKWMSVNQEFEKLLQISGVEYIGKGSLDIAKSLAQRWEMLRSVFSRVTSFGVSSFSSQSLFREQPRESKDFWLVADCELVVYGATQSDAKLYIGEREIKLNPDGTFATRFALSEGQTNIPINAVSKDGDMKRGITIRVKRETEKNDK